MQKFTYLDKKTNQKIEIGYQKTGNNKKYALIMHGWGQNSKTMISIAKALKNDYTVFNLDLPGFGISSMPDNWTIGDYKDAIEDFIAEQNIEEITIIGHSFGGRIGILLASESPVVKHLVLIDSAGIKQGKQLSTRIKILAYKSMSKFIKLPLINKNKIEYEYNLKQIFGSKDFNAANPMLKKIMTNAVNLDLTKQLPKINCQTSLFWGINDKDTPFSHAQKMNKLIHDSKLYSFQAGHYPFLEKPKEFFKKFNEILKVGVK
jgi:pimeloyl-ACP methyl ester carboxylesterase